MRPLHVQTSADCDARGRHGAGRNAHLHAFHLQAHFFRAAQTEGAEYQQPAIPEWDEQRALATLKIERVPFENLDGNVQGYARRGGKIAINPLAALPFKTFCHELAHCLLHRQESDLTDTDQMPRSIAEVEAEAVALLCCESIGLPGAEFGRGYIQSWGNRETISERSAQRVFQAADRILRAGQLTKASSQADKAEIK